jgi:thymidylate synthase (FAD)
MLSSVKLIAYTQSIDKTMSTEEFIAYVARISNPENQNNRVTTKRLLKYLAKEKHWSPFEMTDLVMEICTTRDIGRQILRHRSFTFQEFSQRYADATQLGFEISEARLQDNVNRQNSIESNDVELHESWDLRQQIVVNSAKASYQWAIENGIAKEQARKILPEGLTMSRMYMKGSVRSWIHYCDLRMGNGTQKEHREIANLCWDVVLTEIPSLKSVLQQEA